MRKFCTIVLLCTGCRSGGGTAPRPLVDAAKKLAAQDRAGAVGLYDLDYRLRSELWQTTIKPQKDLKSQVAALQASAPRLGDQAALVTVGDEAFKELVTVAGPLAGELADDRCAAAPLGKDDLGRWETPHELEGMGPELGRFVFELRTAASTSAVRAQCPSGSLWLELAQRKGGPLQLVRLEK
jgi:hypothetical protein